MTKNGFYFNVIALLFAELLKILIYKNEMTCDVQPGTETGVMSQKNEYITIFSVILELKLSTVVTLITKFHDMSTVTFPWQHTGLQALSIQRGKSEFSSFKKCYLLFDLVVHSVGVSE